MVAHPTAFSLSDLKTLPPTADHRGSLRRRLVVCSRVDRNPLANVLNQVGVLPQTRYIVYYASEPYLWGSIDMADAMHPQTLLAMGMNDGDLPVKFGGPLASEYPPASYKSLKFLTHITHDSLKHFGKAWVLWTRIRLFLVRRHLSPAKVATTPAFQRAQHHDCHSADDPR